MTGVVSVRWHIEPASLPIPLRHCGTCRQTRAFHSSGKIRLNANGRKLDAWLIYKCVQCDRTWNRPIYERTDVRTIATETLVAMQHSTADWVRPIERDAAALKQHCEQVFQCGAVDIVKPPPRSVPSDWGQLDVHLSVNGATGVRLDRLLAQEFQLSRSALRGLVDAGHLCIAPSPKLLRKALRADVLVRMSRTILAHTDHQTLRRALFS